MRLIGIRDKKKRNQVENGFVAFKQPSRKQATKNPVQFSDQVIVDQVSPAEGEKFPDGIPRNVIVQRKPGKILPRPQSYGAESGDDSEYSDSSTIATGTTTVFTSRTYTLADAFNEVAMDTTYMSSLMCAEMGNATDYLVGRHISPLFKENEQDEKEQDKDQNQEQEEETTKEGSIIPVNQFKSEESATKRKKIIEVQSAEDETCAALEVGFDGSRHAIVATSNDNKPQPALFSWTSPIFVGEKSKTVVESVDFVAAGKVSKNMKQQERKIENEFVDAKEAAVTVESLLSMKGRIAEIKEVQKRRFQNLTGITNEDEEEDPLYRL